MLFNFATYQDENLKPTRLEFGPIKLHNRQNK